MKRFYVLSRRQAFQLPSNGGSQGELAQRPQLPSKTPLGLARKTLQTAASDCLDWFCPEQPQNSCQNPAQGKGVLTLQGSAGESQDISLKQPPLPCLVPSSAPVQASAAQHYCAREHRGGKSNSPMVKDSADTATGIPYHINKLLWSQRQPMQPGLSRTRASQGGVKRGRQCGCPLAQRDLPGKDRARGSSARAVNGKSHPWHTWEMRLAWEESAITGGSCMPGSLAH